MARLVFLPRTHFTPHMPTVRFEVHENHFAPHDPVRPPSAKHVDIDPQRLIPNVHQDTFMDAAQWFGLPMTYAWTTISDLDIKHRFWDREAINSYLESLTGTILIARQDDATWRMQMSNPADSQQFHTWFYAQTRGHTLKLTLPSEDHHMAMREWMATELVGRHDYVANRIHGTRALDITATIERQTEAAAFKIRWFNLPKEEDETA